MIKWKQDYPIEDLKWIDPLLKGISYWVGYKGELYRHYPLTEGAIVAEAVSLIHGKLNEPQRIDCEVMYKDLGMDVDIVGQARADLVIKEEEEIKAVLEVKRAKSSNANIDIDLERLADYHRHNNSSRCFLLLVSQRMLPERFVDPENGEAIKKDIPTKNYVARPRRACKATSTFRSKKSANYSCLIEVVSNKHTSP